MATVEATTQRVQRILTSEFDDVRLSKGGGFAVQYGSTVTFIEPTEWVPDSDGNARSLVRVWAPIGRDVQPTAEMYRWAATEGQSMVFGGVAVLEDADGRCFLMFDHTLLGDFLDPAELITTVIAVVITADDLDDVVRDRFGGKRYTDPG